MLGWLNDLLVAGMARLQSALYGERGQTLAEYGMILSFLAVTVIVIAVVGFRDTLAETFNTVGACLDGDCTDP